MVAAAIIAGAVLTARAQNLLADGDFERPAVPIGGYTDFAVGQSIGPWTVVGEKGNVQVVDGQFAAGGFEYPARSGHQWLDLTGHFNTATGVQQAVATVPGRRYRVAFSIGNVVDLAGGAGSSSTVHVLVDGVTVMTATSFESAGRRLAWKTFMTFFTATSARTFVAFLNGDPPSDGTNGLDDVSVVEIPAHGGGPVK